MPKEENEIRETGIRISKDFSGNLEQLDFFSKNENKATSIFISKHTLDIIFVIERV